MIAHSIEDLIGNTPLLELCALEKAYGLKARLLAKLESYNPTGSAKDRPSLTMLEGAERSGRLAPGGTIIEPTSGNTGIGLAMLGAVKGYRVIIVMPDSMSVERQRLMTAYGAELVLTPGAEGMTGSIAKAKALAAEIPGSFIPDQFANPDNAAAHYLGTGPELWAQTEGDIDVFVAGIGTGGTFSGTVKYLKERKPALEGVAVEPASSPLLSRGYAGPHGLQGIGANFVPELVDRSLIDRIEAVTDEDAFRCARELAKTEGVLAGITSGAALFAALKLARTPEYEGKTIVALLPDTGMRYLSGLYAED